METASDADLVARAAAGQADSMGELFDRHAGRMKSLALRILRLGDEAEDVVQEVFVQAWQQPTASMPNAATSSRGSPS